MQGSLLRYAPDANDPLNPFYGLEPAPASAKTQTDLAGLCRPKVRVVEPLCLASAPDVRPAAPSVTTLEPCAKVTFLDLAERPAAPPSLARRLGRAAHHQTTLLALAALMWGTAGGLAGYATWRHARRTQAALAPRIVPYPGAASPAAPPALSPTR
jgi:hypothetical protein